MPADLAFGDLALCARRPVGLWNRHILLAGLYQPRAAELPYPFISLGIVLGLFSAWAIFHETILSMRWVGISW